MGIADRKDSSLLRSIQNAIGWFLARSDWWAIGISISLFLIFVLFNVFAHKVVAMNTAETDNYFLTADRILRGELYHDPYHPPLYALLAAGLSLLLHKNTFLAASLISSVATGITVGMVYIFARQFLKPGYALLVQLLVAINDVVIEHGIWAATDALYSMLSIGLLVLLVRQLQNSGGRARRYAVVVGVLWGLAYLTRYTALFLFPVILFALWKNPWPNKKIFF